MKKGQSDKKDQKLLWRIHHWAGVYTGLIIGVLCFTGAVAVFIPEITILIQKNHYAVSSTVTSPGTLPKIGKALDEAKKRYPKMSGLLIDMPDEPDQPARFSFAVKGKDKASNKFYNLFVDIGQDKIVGEANLQNSFANYLRQIHVRLYEGFWGRQLVGLGGVSFIVVTVTGFLIYGNFMKKQPYPKIRKGRGMRILMADWHKILGITALAFNFVIACTGAWLGLQPKLMNWFNIKAPNDFKTKEIMTPDEDKQLAVHWDEVFKVAKQQFPDLRPGYVRSSEDGSATVEINGSVAGQVYERNINSIVLSKTTLKPLFKFDARKGSFSDKFYSVQEALHFGDFGGLTLKILYTLLGLVSAFLSISGFVVYLYRTEKKEKRKISPLKTTFVYCLVLILVLSVIALISMLIGYKQAATVAAYLVNGSLIAFVIYCIVQPILSKRTPETKGLKP